MGTHCYIGIEETDGTVRFIFIHYDGYFCHIIPMLRKYYATRENVKRLIEYGNKSILCLPHELSEETIDEDEKPQTVAHRYAFEELVHHKIEYYYLFTKEDKWLCQTSQMMDIDMIHYDHEK